MESQETTEDAAIGDTPTCAPPDPHPKKPGIALPPLSCDSHFHIFGPGRVFPYAAGRPFTPPDAPKERLFALHALLGFERGVIVQSACHGSDHSALLDAMAAGSGRYRGVALLTSSTPREDVARLDRAGICGVRFHFAAHLGARASLDEMQAVVRLIEPYGWHVAVHTTGTELLNALSFIQSIKAPVVIDHIGRTPVAEGIEGPCFLALRRLVDSGRVWVKLSGTERISREAFPYRDAVAMARTIATQAPERVLWGTDWPHPNMHGPMPNDGDLVNLIAHIAPDASIRHLMLVDNPAAFFGFKPQAGM